MKTTAFKYLLAMLCVILASLSSFAQTPARLTAGAEGMKTEIGFDLSVPDFDVRSIDAKVIGDRLARILTFLHDNYVQSSFERKFITLIGSQNDKLSSVPFHIKRLKLMRVSKHGDVLTIKYNAQLGKNGANIKKVEFDCVFVDGVSEDNTVNELFSKASHYVQAKEQYEGLIRN